MSNLESIVSEFEKELKFLVAKEVLLFKSAAEQSCESNIDMRAAKDMFSKRFIAVAKSAVDASMARYRWKMEVHREESWLGLELLMPWKAWQGHEGVWIDARWSGPKFRRHVQSPVVEEILVGELVKNGPGMLAYIQEQLAEHAAKLQQPMLKTEQENV